MAVQRVGFSFAVEFLDALARGDVKVCVKGCDVSIVTADYCHLCSVGFYQSNSVFALVNYLLKFVGVDQMGEVLGHDEGVIPGVEMLEVVVIALGYRRR